MSSWTPQSIPSQAGRLAVVTGATGGLGLETALALAGAGAEIVLAGRNEDKGRGAIETIEARHPGAALRFEKVDLASLASVADFAGRLIAAGRPIDLLINNAGVMALPTRRVSADGFELQFATNFLSHFALTGRLLPLLRRGRAPRVVNLASLAHRTGRIDFADLQGDRIYLPWRAYAQSKLAMLVFALELDRRSRAEGWGIMGNAAHPGWARTDLVDNGPRAEGGFQPLWLLSRLAAPILSQSAAEGAWPTLLAATAAEAEGGAYYGPTGMGELKGPAGSAHMTGEAKDPETGRKLWEAAAALTGIRFDGEGN